MIMGDTVNFKYVKEVLELSLQIVNGEVIPERWLGIRNLEPLTLEIAADYRSAQFCALISPLRDLSILYDSADQVVAAALDSIDTALKQLEDAASLGPEYNPLRELPIRKVMGAALTLLNKEKLSSESNPEIPDLEAVLDWNQALFMVLSYTIGMVAAACQFPARSLVDGYIARWKCALQ